MVKRQSPFRWLVLALLIGAVVLFARQTSPENLPIRSYNVRDYVRGAAVVIVRLPNTINSDGLISLTQLGVLILDDRETKVELAPADIATILTFHDQWCPKSSVVPSNTERTSNYVVGLQCRGTAGRQFEFSRETLPPEMVLMLQLAGVEH